MNKNEKKTSCGKKALVVLCGMAVTVAGFVIIPPLIDKYANKVYKTSLSREDINFNEMGPEIVPNNETEE